jgi:hypothetical protein
MAPVSFCMNNKSYSLNGKKVSPSSIKKSLFHYYRDLIPDMRNAYDNLWAVMAPYLQLFTINNC